MTSSQPDTTGSLRAARQIDELCDRFEAAWKSRNPLRIEDLLQESAGSARARLLEELLLLEISLRKRAGETPIAADYAARFTELPRPALEEILRRGLGEIHSRGSTRGDASTVAHVSGGSQRIAPPRLRYFGDYELLDQIARGGMGVVYKARQISLNRLVAVKMILSGQFASEAQVKRFYSEAESAAQLDHPNIVSIYEVGEHEGDHYFSMALVEGTSLAAKLAEGPMEPRRAAELVSQVAQAIEYAHSKGVIHRDLKPSNVLLDVNGRPRVTDFGLAKRVSDSDGMTMTGDVLGTPSYMPPEQAAGKIDAVGPASDVYALGAVLYALLAGRPPFQAASSMDTLRQVVDQEPARLRQLNGAIPRDLETITQKCLEKSVARRYTSAAALAQDLDNYLAGRPIQARPTTRTERAWRWCRRNPVVASLTAALLIMLVTIALVSTGAYFRETKLNNELTVRGNALQAKTTQLTEALERESELVLSERAAKLEEGQAKRDAQQAQQDEREQRVKAERQTRLAESQRLAAQARIALDQYPQRSLLLAIEAIQTTRSHDEPVTPMAEQVLRDGLANFSGVALDRRRGYVKSVDVSPDGKWLAVVDSYGGIGLYDVTEIKEGLQPLVLATRDMNVVEISADGSVLAAGGDKEVKLWNLKVSDPSRSMRKLASHTKPVESICLSADGKLLATGSDDQTARLWNLERDESEEPLMEFGGHVSAVEVVKISLDKRWLLSIDSGIKGIGQLWDLNQGDGRPRPLAIAQNYLKYAAFSSDSRRLAVGSVSDLLILDLTAPDIVKSGRKSRMSGDYIRFSPGDRWLIKGPRFFDLKQTDPFANPKLLSVPGRVIAVTADGKQAVSNAFMGSHVWDLTDQGPAREPKLMRGHDQRVSIACYCEARNILFTGGADASVRAWPLQQDQARGDPLVFSQLVLPKGAAFSPDGRWMATTAFRQILSLWNLRSDSPNQKPVHLNRFTGEEVVKSDLYRSDAFRWDTSFGFTPDSRYIVTGDNDHQVRIWDLEKNPVEVRTLTGHTAAVGTLSISPSGRWLATGSSDKTVRLWDLTAPDVQKTAQVLTGHTGWISGVQFSPNSHWLASTSDMLAQAGGKDEVVRLWNVTATDPQASLLEFPGHQSGGCAAFSPDSRWMFTGATTSINDAGRIWDLTSARPNEAPQLLRRPGKSAASAFVAMFSRDGRWLATGGRSPDYLVLYDMQALATGGNGRVFPHELATDPLPMFSADSKRLLTPLSNAICIWDLSASDPALEPIRLEGHSGMPRIAAVSKDGRWLATCSNDSTVRLWRMDLSELMTEAKRAAGRKLSADEKKLFRVNSEP